ncbi:MAG: phosphoribosylformylglycinamidine cyclo-ligase [Actinobacteria bacterium]|nr:phosphoribosylformylglycinamidine cyclo-ligase [Actinomycetota bacterium]
MKKLRKYTYRNSGVNLDSAAKAVDLIKKSVFSTFNKNVLSDLTSYAGLFSFDTKVYREPVLVSSTDGVGTKLLVAKETGLYGEIGQDLVAMCINDILCCGAKPLFFLDYIACGRLVPEKIGVIVSSIAQSCKACNTTLIGGETAEMPDMYAEDDIDLAGFAVGVVEKNRILNPALVSTEDAVFGVASSGVHSNGFSLIRKIIRDKKIDLDRVYELNDESNLRKTLGAVLMEPTKLYYSLVHYLLENKIKLHGVSHITGGGFYENINRIIPGSLDVIIQSGSWPVPGIFSFFERTADILKKEMFRVFNMGIGMVLIAGPNRTDKIISLAAEAGEKVYRIGSVVKGSGRVLIEI